MRLLLVGLLVAGSMTACTQGDDGAQRAAERLAAAFSDGTLPEDLFRGGSPQQEYDEIVAGLDDVEVSVSASEVTTEDDTADVSLRWSWALRGHEWRYTAPARLVHVAEDWKATWTPALVEPTLTHGETLESSTLRAQRGEILGAGGQPLVTDRTVLRFGIDKTRTTPRRARDSARRLAALVGVDPAAYVREVEAAGPLAYVEAIALRPEDARTLDPAYDQLPGVLVIKEEAPLAPTREFAAAVLGRVGPATAELVEESAGRIRAGDVVGLSGLQQRYDERLAGVPGVRVEAVQAVTADGTSTDPEAAPERRILFSAKPVAGEPLRTTLDLSLQSKAEGILARGVPGSPEPASALVAIRPSSGAVLVAANGEGAAGQNLATYGQFAPGSTFKVVSSLALLREGLTPASRVQCPASLSVNGKRFSNYSDYPESELGAISLRDAVAYSCNTAFVAQRRRITGQELADAAASLGFGVDHDLGFPAYFGQVPAPVSGTEAAADLIGQGKVLASPLVLAAVTASVATGKTVVPHLLEPREPRPQPSTPLTRREAGMLRELMHAVVAEGSGRVLAGLPGPVGAKTGTAEYGTGGRTHAWMVAYRGDLAVSVFVETGESGSATAGPLLLDFLS